MIVYVIWVSFVVLWNYIFPVAPPIADVVVAVLLSLLSSRLKYLIKPYTSNFKMENKNKYWHENIKIILKCLLVWFIVSYVFGIIIVHEFNLIKIGGYKLGFWFAQQGSIFTFVFLIFYYSKKIAELDKKYEK